MIIAIIDYGSGNLHSVEKAFFHAADKIGKAVAVTSDPDALRGASHIVLPGVGAFADCMNGLRAVDGMVDALQECVIEKGTYFFGICVGMQMMLDRGLEHGEHAGLGWIAGDVVHLFNNSPLEGESKSANVMKRDSVRGSDSDHEMTAICHPHDSPDGSSAPPSRGSNILKIPHMGWNELELLQSDHPILANIKNGDHVYFVHSYHAQCADDSTVLARSDYGGKISACIGKDNMIGTQFHPEKSHHVGLQLIENFVRQ